LNLVKGGATLEKTIFKIEKKDVNKRLDLFLKEQKTEFSRSQIKNFITSGFVLKNSKTQKSGAILKENDIVELTIPNLISTAPKPENLPLDIIYQDKDFAVINKTQGMVVHSGNANYSGTLVNALLFHFKQLSDANGDLRPGIVHRLDKNTSGLMLVAKNNHAHKILASQISDKRCVRKYLALLEGNLKDDNGIIQTYIARNPRKRTLMTASETENSENKTKKIAITEYNVLERFKGYCLVEFSLKTGRTHQIRVHCSEILHRPIVGDLEYGGSRVKDFPKKMPASKGQYLHAYQIEFFHPTTNEYCIFNAPLPDYFESLLQFLRKNKKE
jgi:23S rRNA pseudouridine1911/1915/1917 synthase